MASAGSAKRKRLSLLRSNHCAFFTDTTAAELFKTLEACPWPKHV